MTDGDGWPEGAELNDSLKALKDPVVRARQQYPQVQICVQC